jgi:hypothetical protein
MNRTTARTIVARVASACVLSAGLLGAATTAAVAASTPATAAAPAGALAPAPGHGGHGHGHGSGNGHGHGYSGDDPYGYLEDDPEYDGNGYYDYCAFGEYDPDCGGHADVHR